MDIKNYNGSTLAISSRNPYTNKVDAVSDCLAALPLASGSMPARNKCFYIVLVVVPDLSVYECDMYIYNLILQSPNGDIFL